jgi:ADP-heptose:LPS heptosyltransferase
LSGAHTFPPEPRILVITMRRLGDVLLTTPLVHALRRGIAGVRVDMLVFRGSEGILAGNPDIERVIVFPDHASAAQSIALFRALWRRYDVAISTQAGDRPTFLAAVAGRFSVGLVDPNGAAWKRWLLDRPVVIERDVHRVTGLLRLAAVLGIEARPDIVLPAPIAPLAPRGAYAVIHAKPMVTLLSGAAVYVGADTSMSHLAAAAGCPTVAIFGPTSPSLIGSWPVGGLREPWAPAGSIRQRGNVWVVQNPLPCMPCDSLGCERHLESYSTCLDELPARQVIAAVDLALGRISAAPSILPARAK